MGKLHDLIRDAKRATLIEVARCRHKQHMLKSSFKPWGWWHEATVQAGKAQQEGALARIRLRRYLRLKGLPADSPIVPKTPIT